MPVIAGAGGAGGIDVAMSGAVRRAGVGRCVGATDGSQRPTCATTDFQRCRHPRRCAASANSVGVSIRPWTPRNRSMPELCQVFAAGGRRSTRKASGKGVSDMATKHDDDKDDAKKRDDDARKKAAPAAAPAAAPPPGPQGKADPHGAV